MTTSHANSSEDSAVAQAFAEGYRAGYRAAIAHIANDDNSLDIAQARIREASQLLADWNVK